MISLRSSLRLRSVLEVKTYNAARSLHSFGLAVQLISKPFDVVQAIGNDNGVSPQGPLDCRVLRRPSVFLTPRFAIDAAIDPKAFVVDMTHTESAGVQVYGGIDF